MRTLRVLRASEGASEERTGQAMFEGQVWGRGVITADDESDLTSTVVQFAAGARTRMHTHTRDQMLYIVSGIGKVGTGDAEHVVATGDVAIIPAGEPHWHGAGDTGSPMVHLMVMRADSQSEVLG